MFEGPILDIIPDAEKVAEEIKGRVERAEIFDISGNDIFNYAMKYLPDRREIIDVPNESEEDMDVLVMEEGVYGDESYIYINRSETYQSDILFNAVARGFIPGQRSRRFSEGINSANA